MADQNVSASGPDVHGAGEVMRWVAVSHTSAVP
jgi:hypothetical protein